ncbi:DUF6197 family protein [Streptomyces sp. NPDC000594]|uniref:DUF6197 family protein n=1 Tax=Streptomyces sp. NPDC000594 TaxID=3154261 RepID=UPI00332FC44A
MPRIRYNPESIVIPADPAAILDWAACHITAVGLHQGSELFAGIGRTVTLPCWPRGAIDVAAGNGRGSSSRTYDWAAIDRGRDQAYHAFAEYLAARPLAAGTTDSARWLHRSVMDEWSAVPGRTAEQAAQALRAAAETFHRLF